MVPFFDDQFLSDFYVCQHLLGVSDLGLVTEVLGAPFIGMSLYGTEYH